MKLIEFNPETLPSNGSGQSQLPRLSVSFKNGVFSINGPACDLIKVKAGDQVQLLQDEETPENWYIEKVKTGGYTLREKEGTTSPRFFNSTQLAHCIKEFLETNGKSCRVPIAGEVTEFDKRKLYGLLISGAKVK